MNRSQLALTAFFFISWSLLTLTLSFYFVASGDEGGYQYQSWFLSRGFVPVLEFFTQHGIWAYLPFSTAASLLGPNLESMRLPSVLALIAMAAMTGLLVGRRFGSRAGLLALVLLAFSWPWTFHTIEVRHSMPANLGLVTAFFLLFHPRKFHPGLAFLAGVFLAIAFNARAVLVPMVLLYAALLVIYATSGRERGFQLRCLGAAAVGSVVTSIPSLYLLIKDPDAFLFDYLTARVDLTFRAEYHVEGVLGWILWFAETRLFSLVQFVTGLNRQGNWSNAVLLLPFVVAAAGKYRTPDASPATGDPLIRAALWVALGIFGCYSLADRTNGGYLHHAIPFLVIAGVGVLARSGLLPSQGRNARQRGITLAMALVLLPYVGWYGTFVAGDIVRRNEPSIARPVTVAQVGCWLERHTSPDTVVMSYFGAAATAGGRFLPRGYEQGQGLIDAFWFHLPPETAQRYRIMIWEDYRHRLLAGKIPVVVDDYYPWAYVDQPGMDLPAILQEHFHRVATTGGAFPYTIYVHESIPTESLAPLPPPHALRLDTARVRQLVGEGRWSEVLRDGAFDLATSLSELPRDLAGSLARAVGAGFDARCGNLLAAPVEAVMPLRNDGG